MAPSLAVAVGFVVVGTVLVAVLGAVERPEKTTFVAGVAVLAAGPILVGGVGFPELLGGFVSLVGVVAVVASTVPLLRQSPTTS